MCPHTPPCPDPSGPDREAARTIISHPEQGWSLLCNGIIVFEDTGELLPDGHTIAPHRPTDLITWPVSPAGVTGSSDKASLGGSTGGSAASPAQPRRARKAAARGKSNAPAA
jgi:hypothetical protein